MPTILVIDDNPAVATALEVLFSLHDIATVHAGSPEAGLALLDEGDVDLVISGVTINDKRNKPMMTVKLNNSKCWIKVFVIVMHTYLRPNANR